MDRWTCISRGKNIGGGICMEALLLEIKNKLDELEEKLDINRVAFNSKQAANYLSISVDTLLRMARIGEIRYLKNGSHYLFRKKYLDEWLDKQERRFGR